MKTIISLSLLGMLAAPVWAASPSNEVQEAVSKLADKPNYTWVSKLEQKRTNGFRMEPPSGMTEKGGFTSLTFKMRDSSVLAIRKGEKVALKQDDEWKTAEEMSEGDGGGGGFGRGGFGPLPRAQRAKLPTVEADELLKRVKELKKESDGVYSGELSKEGIKQMFSFGGGRGGGATRTNAPAGGDGARRGGRGGGGGGMDTSGLTGSAKFWITDGVLSKYENHIEGEAPGFNGQEMDWTRTTTVEIKDIGSTKVEVPAEAKKKLARAAAKKD